MTQRRVAVIGAGAAGLCAAKHLLAKGVDVVVYELGTRIGGLWVYENDNGLSGAYQSLHVNSENKVTAYKDFPFADSAPMYPDHAQMAQYLVDYAERFDLRRHIRFNARVTAVAITRLRTMTSKLDRRNSSAKVERVNSYFMKPENSSIEKKAWNRKTKSEPRNAMPSHRSGGASNRVKNKLGRLNSVSETDPVRLTLHLP